MPNPEIENIYFATVQKTGSQWLKGIFDDPRIKEYTQLSTYPQHDYEYGEFHSSFPKYTFVPGLYISYQAYEYILNKKTEYRTIYIIRDPRDIVVSWYYSMYESHPSRKGVNQIREYLKSVSKEEGIKFSIHFLNDRFSYMRSWIDLGKDNKNILFIKFENLINSNYTVISEILDFCKISVPSEELKEILMSHTKEKMRAADVKHRKDKSISHYREKQSDHKSEFNQSHYEYFYNLTGDLVNVLGYE